MNRKKILLVCKETSTMAMHFLAKLLRNEDADLRAFFIFVHEPLLDGPYYKFFKKMNPDIPLYDMGECGKRLLDCVTRNKIEPDKAYLNKIERIYSKYRNINLQFMSSQFHAYYYHDLNYFHHVSYDVHLCWLQFYYQRIEQMLDEFQPDVIYDIDTAEIGRTILLEVTSKRKIPYINLEQARFEDYSIPSNTQGLAVFAPLKGHYELLRKQYSAGDTMDTEGFRYLENYRKKSRILADDYKLKNALLKRWNVFGELKKIICMTWVAFIRSFKSLRFEIHPVPFLNHPFRRIQVEWIAFFRNCIIRWFEHKYFSRVNTKKCKYILFPLHLIPESSTFTYAPFFCTESFIIESLSKSVPWDVKILAKEHWSMLGQRPLSFYKKMKRLPNVILVSPFQSNDPKPLIEDSIGVVTITGTTALEAAFLRKPSITFGPTPFEILSCVHRISDVTQMAGVISQWLDGESAVSDYELAAYIESVYKFGHKFSLRTLLVQNPTMDVSKGDQWVKSTRNSILKRRVLRLFGLERLCPPPAELKEPKIKEDTQRLKEVLDLGYEYAKDSLKD